MGIMLPAALKIFCNSLTKQDPPPPVAITADWWAGLSEEWKTILIINQSFQKQGITIYAMQEEYLNRSNTSGEAYSEMNCSLTDLMDKRRFKTGYAALYERAIRNNKLIRTDSIDLRTLGDLDTIYLVNGPDDLTPLTRFPQLKVLIINYCGITTEPVPGKRTVNLEPLKYLNKLTVLHCYSSGVASLDPIRNLVSLEELICDNTRITTLAPLKKLGNLKRLSVGSKGINASDIAQLANLEELYIHGCEKLPDLSRLKKLKKLAISEGELSLVRAGYRITDIGFLKHLPALEFLDLERTSYRGNLAALHGLQNLKAVSLPRVSTSEMKAFREIHKKCTVINAYLFGNW
jgi:Leucine-rich repeat (LRR) protein